MGPDEQRWREIEKLAEIEHSQAVVAAIQILIAETRRLYDAVEEVRSAVADTKVV